MSKSKCTLIIDGNWLLMSRLSVLNDRYKDDLALCQDLKILMLKSINLVLRQFPIIDNIIFVSDGGSWRTSIDIPDYLKKDGVEYKGTREKSEDINWELIFSEFENFMGVLASIGITISRELGLEGDDWCYHWSTFLNSENTNVIIWSKDKDLTQLVKTNKDSCFTAWWNKDSGAILEQLDEEELDFLFNPKLSENEHIYQSFIKSAKTVTYVNPKHIVIDKIIRGDMGDNIIPVIYKQSKTNPDKQFRVSQKDIDDTIDIHNETDIINWVSNILSSKSYIGRVNKSQEDIIEHFKYNVKLVELADINYPDDIKEIFENHKEYNISKDINSAINIINASSNQLQSILDII